MPLCHKRKMRKPRNYKNRILKSIIKLEKFTRRSFKDIFGGIEKNVLVALALTALTILAINPCIFMFILKSALLSFIAYICIAWINQGLKNKRNL